MCCISKSKNAVGCTLFFLTVKALRKDNEDNNLNFWAKQQIFIAEEFCDSKNPVFRGNKFDHFFFPAWKQIVYKK